MSTTILTYTRDELVSASIRKLGVLASGQTPSVEELARGGEALNSVLSYLKTKGLMLWLRKNLSFLTTSGVSTYSIGVGQTISTPFPLKLLQAYRTESQTHIPMEIVADYNFNLLPMNTSGLPLKITYQPLVNMGILSLWPTPQEATTINIVYTRPLEFGTSGTETIDMPDEWYLPIIYSLAKTLAPEYTLPLEDRRALAEEAREYTEAVSSFGSEEASLFFYPDRQR